MGFLRLTRTHVWPKLNFHFVQRKSVILSLLNIKMNVISVAKMFCTYHTK